MLTNTKITPAQLTDELIGAFRQIIDRQSALLTGEACGTARALMHDCMVASGARRSPHRGGRNEARQRVCDAINKMHGNRAAIDRLLKERAHAKKDDADTMTDAEIDAHPLLSQDQQKDCGTLRDLELLGKLE